MNKQQLLHLAEVLDAFRVFPRLFLMITFIWAVWITQFLLHFYVELPLAERTYEVSGFAGACQLGVMGFLKGVYAEYSKGGRAWDDVAPVTTATTQTTTQVTQPVTP